MRCLNLSPLSKLTLPYVLCKSSHLIFYCSFIPKFYDTLHLITQSFQSIHPATLNFTWEEKGLNFMAFLSQGRKSVVKIVEKQTHFRSRILSPGEKIDRLKVSLHINLVTCLSTLFPAKGELHSSIFITN